MKYKKIMKDSMDLGTLTITQSTMASAVTGVGGNASGLGVLASFTPTFATLTGTKHTLGMVKSLTPKKKKKR